jgi:hypothetical protein
MIRHTVFTIFICCHASAIITAADSPLGKAGGDVASQLSESISRVFSGQQRDTTYLKRHNGLSIEIQGFENYDPRAVFLEIQSQAKDAPVTRGLLFNLLVDSFRCTKKPEREAIPRWLLSMLLRQDNKESFDHSKAVWALRDMDYKAWPTPMKQKFLSAILRRGNLLNDRAVMKVGEMIPSTLLTEHDRKELCALAEQWKKKNTKRKKNPSRHVPNPWQLVLARHGNRAAIRETTESLPEVYRATVKGVSHMTYIGRVESYKVLVENLFVEAFVTPPFYQGYIAGHYGRRSLKVLGRVITNIPEDIALRSSVGAWDSVVDLRNWVASQKSIEIKGVSGIISVDSLSIPAYETPSSIRKLIPKKYRGRTGLATYRKEVNEAKKAYAREQKRKKDGKSHATEKSANAIDQRLEQ